MVGKFRSLRAPAALAHSVYQVWMDCEPGSLRAASWFCPCRYKGLSRRYVRVGCACLFLSACRDTCSYHAESVPSGSCEAVEDTVFVPGASTVLGTYKTLNVTE